MANSTPGKSFFMVAILVLVAVVAFLTLNAPDRRTTGEKIGDAVNELPNGVDKAARQLENRTPGDKLHDAAKDAVDNTKKAINQ